MEQEARNVDFPSIRKIFGYWKEMMRNAIKPEEPEEDKLDKVFIDTLNKVDGMEKSVRIGNTTAKGRGKSVNATPTFSKEKSLGVQRAEMKQRTVLGADNQEEQTIDEGIEK